MQLFIEVFAFQHDRMQNTFTLLYDFHQKHGENLAFGLGKRCSEAGMPVALLLSDAGIDGDAFFSGEDQKRAPVVDVFMAGDKTGVDKLAYHLRDSAFVSFGPDGDFVLRDAGLFAYAQKMRELSDVDAHFLETGRQENVGLFMQMGENHCVIDFSHYSPQYGHYK